MGKGGCFGPRKLKNDVYIQLITQMHENAIIPQRESFKKLDMYEVIKQKIKIELKKFHDNLSSHRNKIIQSGNFNYKLTSQSKQIQRHYVGLIIADAIIDLIFPHNFHQIHTPNIQKFKISDRQSFFTAFDSYTKHSDIQKKSISKNYGLPCPKNLIQFNQENKTQYVDQYFKLIVFLFQNQKRIHYPTLLKRLNIFLQKHRGQINCQTNTWKIAQKMIQNISKNIQLDQSCQALSAILSKTKDQFIQELRDSQILYTILVIWLKKKQEDDIESSHVEVNCYRIIQLYFNRCISSWDSQFLFEVMFRVFDGIELDTNKLDLIEEMYEQILKNHDLKLRFFRDLFNYLLCYLSVTHQNVMGEQDKKWFKTSFGLNYEKMQLQYKNVLKDTTKLEGFKLVNRWIYKKYTDINQFCMYNTKALIFVYISNAKCYYKNKTTFQLLMNQYFQILNNLNKQNRQLFKERVFQDFREDFLTEIQYQLLLKLIKEMLFREERMSCQENQVNQGENYHNVGNNHQKAAFLNSQNLKSFYKGFYQSQNEGKMVSTISQLQQNESMAVTRTSSTWFGQDINIYLTPILTNYKNELKLQLLKIIGYIFDKIDQLKFNDDNKQKLCQFFYSIYQNIISINSNIYQKYQFTYTVLSLLRIMLMKSNQIQNNMVEDKKCKSMYQNNNCNNKQKYIINCRLFLEAFLFHICKQIKSKSTLTKLSTISYKSKLNLSSVYILLYLMYQSKNMLLNHKINVENYKSTQSQKHKFKIQLTNNVEYTSPSKTTTSKGSMVELNGQKQIDVIRSKMSKINTKMTMLFHDSQNRKNNQNEINDGDEEMNKFYQELLLQIQKFVKDYQDVSKKIIENENYNQTQQFQIQIQPVDQIWDKPNPIKSIQKKNSKQMTTKQQQEYAQYLLAFKKLFQTTIKNNPKQLENRFISIQQSADGNTSLVSYESGNKMSSARMSRKLYSTRSFADFDESFQEVLDMVHP